MAPPTESSESFEPGDDGDPRDESVVLESLGAIVIVKKEVTLGLRGGKFGIWFGLMYKGS